eukprot:TRINITY_DN18230_c0_g1_i1.p1 TRINITY_DN18230_c0_g1~~TRINITY_DN18230_c0_g1_i1.p1  ORF type:complete len:225 (+),score=37.30 TRINITY_DN18230_c0_g1_i1:65-739(+)
MARSILKAMKTNRKIAKARAKAKLVPNTAIKSHSKRAMSRAARRDRQASRLARTRKPSFVDENTELLLDIVPDPSTDALRDLDFSQGRKGTYLCQTFALSSLLGEDGKVRTEKYAASDVANFTKKVREKKQAYLNTATRSQIAALTRQVGSWARSIVKTRCGADWKEQDVVRGMREDQRAQFDSRFRKRAKSLPAHGVKIARLENAPSTGKRTTKTTRRSIANE